MLLTKYLLKCSSSTLRTLSLTWKLSGCSPVLRHYYFCKTFHLKCLTVFWIRLCPGNYSVNCTTTFCYVLHQTHSKLSCHIQHSVFSGICPHNQSYSALVSHIYAYWDFIKAYSALCLILAYPQPYHILSPGIFRTGGLFKTLWNVNQAYSEPCHRALFSHIQTYSEPCATLAYAKTWHTRNSRIFRTPP